uniref:Uncharacterized protein n=1 Tax=Jaculus jaculus TaxID=51337 RepID=A0A8C5KM59_JACJA
IILATLLLLSVTDGRVAYLQSPYAGYLGFWTNCKRHKCANVGQVTVLIHMSKGFIILALALGLFLLSSMVLSFQQVFRRLRKIDLLFSVLSISIGFLISLSMIFFVIECKRLFPRPQESCPTTKWACGAAGCPPWIGGQATSAGSQDIPCWSIHCVISLQSSAMRSLPACLIN